MSSGSGRDLHRHADLITRNLTCLPFLCESDMQKRRHFMKAVTYRTAATGLTMLLAYIATGEVMVALMVAPADFVLKLLLFYLHERVWNKVRWDDKD